MRLGVRALLVEAHLAILAKADYHEVNLAYRLIEVCAVLRNLTLGDCTIGDVHILGLYVDMLKELVVDMEVAALLLCATYGVELIERVYRYALKRNLTRLVALNQLAVETEGCAASG